VAILSAPYVPRRPHETVLYRLVREHLGEFLQHASDTYVGPLPKYVESEFRKYLECGDFARGFVHVQCTHCAGSPHEFAVAFCDALRDTRRGTNCADFAQVAQAGAWRGVRHTWWIACCRQCR
jgi:hypothetical protein